MKYDLIAEAYKNLYESSIDSFITEEIHPIIQQTLNAGYSDDVMKAYQQAFANKSSKNRKY